MRFDTFPEAKCGHLRPQVFDLEGAAALQLGHYDLLGHLLVWIIYLIGPQRRTSTYQMSEFNRMAQQQRASLCQNHTNRCGSMGFTDSLAKTRHGVWNGMTLKCKMRHCMTGISIRIWIVQFHICNPHIVDCLTVSYCVVLEIQLWNRPEW